MELLLECLRTFVSAYFVGEGVGVGVGVRVLSFLLFIIEEELETTYASGLTSNSFMAY